LQQNFLFPDPSQIIERGGHSCQRWPAGNRQD
jgi:hypothetical protein